MLTIEQQKRARIMLSIATILFAVISILDATNIMARLTTQISIVLLFWLIGMRESRLKKTKAMRNIYYYVALLNAVALLSSMMQLFNT